MSQSNHDTSSTPASTPAANRSFLQLMRDRRVLSWSLYDCANSVFATTVMAGFFPLFFKQYWSASVDGSAIVDPNYSTYLLGNANAVASGILAIASPVLGAIGDQSSYRKRILIMFCALAIVMTGGLCLVAKGDWPMAVTLYIIASIGFAGSNSLYDSLLCVVAPRKELGRTSALGFSLGYLGGGVLFAINVMMTLWPHSFGIPDKVTAVRLSFLTVAIWWLVFTLPLYFFVHEEKKPNVSFFKILKSSFLQILKTFKEIRAIRNVAIFLAAYFFYIDGVNTIMKMAVDYGLALGLPSQDLIVALLMTQFIAFPAALAFIQLAEKIGNKLSLLFAIAAYAGVTIFGYFLKTGFEFFVLAAIIGLFQGGLQSISRSVFAELIPQERAGEYFGFYNMLGKFSSMLGPVLVGATSLLSGDARLSILSLLLLFAIGAGLLFWVQLDSPETP